jgi:hypothetical protein
MPKAILEFDLNDFEDKKSHFRAIKADDMASAIHHFAYNSKKRMFWAVENKEMTPEEAIELVFSEFFANISEHGIIIDELID